MKALIFQIMAAWSLLLLLGNARGAEAAAKENPAGSNTPEAVLPSAAQERSLAMLLQVAKQLERYVQTTNLTSIHNEDAILSAASHELLGQADTLPVNQAVPFIKDLTGFCQTVSSLHLAADLNQQAQSEVELAKVLQAFEKLQSHFSKPIIAAAQVSLNTLSCPLHRDVLGKRGDFCPKCGRELDQICRLMPANSGFPMAGQPTVRATVTTATPLTVGQPVMAYLRLHRVTGEPVGFSDLIETHTKKIHLLIVDRSLTDYHHEHPQPTRTPGEFSFSFTPRKPGSYRVWADLRPNPLGLQEYAVADIAAPTTGEPLTNRAVNFKTTVAGMNYELLLSPKEIKVGRPATATLRVTTADGKNFTQLEPFMAAFAHLVGFNEDYQTVLHLHPGGPPVMDAAARSGPELEFLIFAMRPGFVQLFAQVQIDGRSQFAPFGLRVVP